jgi:hypothetical protein
LIDGIYKIALIAEAEKIKGVIFNDRKCIKPISTSSYEVISEADWSLNVCFFVEHIKA